MVQTGTIGPAALGRFIGMEVLSRIEATDLERLGGSVGSSQFYQTLLRMISTLVPGEFESMTIYSKRSRPQLLHFESTPLSVRPERS